MNNVLRPALVLLLVLTAITGFIYPLVITGLAQVLFPHQAAGSIVMRDGEAIGSSLIGQSFSNPKYFWSRPSATSHSRTTDSPREGRTWGLSTRR